MGWGEKVAVAKEVEMEEGLGEVTVVAVVEVETAVHTVVEMVED